MFAGPVAWMISTQLNYSLAASLCGPANLWIMCITLGLALISLLGSLVCWRQWREQPSVLRVEDSETSIPGKFTAGLGILLGLLFATVILLQGSAGLFISGCTR